MKRVARTIIILASLHLFSTSCERSSQDDAKIVVDTVFVEVPKVEPVKEISVKGKWVSNDNGLYPELEFKGKSTVVLHTILGPFATSYERDEDFIRVKTDKSDLLFEVVSENKIVGSGFANGVWRRKNK